MKGPIAIDTNLLLLLIVGLASPRYVEKHKRLRGKFTADDFDLLCAVIEKHSKIVVLPNTLTEVSNLSVYIDDRMAKSEIRLALKRLATNSEEIFIKSSVGVGRTEFVKLGLTDSVLLELISTDAGGRAITLLTTDLDLAVQAEMHGFSVINFNHLRDL